MASESAQVAEQLLWFSSLVSKGGNVELLQGWLAKGDSAIVIVGRGIYSFKGSGYVRGGIFDRVQLRQFGDTISFRDSDFQRLDDVYAEGIPEFDEMAIFTIRAHAAFDPGSPWSLELLVRRQTGAVAGVFSSFELSYQLPEPYLLRPPPSAEELAEIDRFAQEGGINLWEKPSSAE